MAAPDPAFTGYSSVRYGWKADAHRWLAEHLPDLLQQHRRGYRFRHEGSLRRKVEFRGISVTRDHKNPRSGPMLGDPVRQHDAVHLARQSDVRNYEFHSIRCHQPPEAFSGVRSFEYLEPSAGKQIG